MLEKVTLQKQITILFLFTLFIPIILLSLLASLASYTIVTRNMDRHTDSILSTMAETIELYQEDLQRLTIIPYLHDDVFFAIKLKSTGQYEMADDYTRLLADRALSTILPRYLRVTRDDILGFSIYMKSGLVYRISKTSLQESPFPIIDDESSLLETNQLWLESVFAANGSAILLGNQEDISSIYKDETQIFSVARMIKDPDSQEYMGIIVADADTRVLDRFVRNLDFDVSFKACILDRWGAPVYMHGLEPGTADGAPIEGFRMSSRTVGDSGWQISVYLSETELLQRSVWIFTFGMVLIFSGIIVAIVLYRRLTVSVVQPINELLATMKAVEQGNLSVRVRYKSEAVKDMIIICENLNHMIQSLEFYIQQEYVSRMRQQEAEYQALQSQIKPHFVLNTLNGLLMLNQSGEKVLLDESIRNLAVMLRYIQQETTKTSLQEEFNFITSYCHLQHMRFSDRMQFSITLDEKIAGVAIPRLMVQPLVENSVIHGMEPLSRSCTIQISATSYHEYDSSPSFVLIKVADNGAGFNPSTLKSTNSIGMNNCFERLRIAFPHSEYLIQSGIGKGTLITMKFMPNKE